LRYLRLGRRAGRRRVSMVVYLVAAFTACLLALGTMMAMTTAASFRRERERASVELRAAAQDNAHCSSKPKTSKSRRGDDHDPAERARRRQRGGT